MGTRIRNIDPLTGRISEAFSGSPTDREVYLVRMSRDLLYRGESDADAAVVAARIGASIQRDLFGALLAEDER